MVVKKQWLGNGDGASTASSYTLAVVRMNRRFIANTRREQQRKKVSKKQQSSGRFSNSSCSNICSKVVLVTAAINNILL